MGVRRHTIELAQAQVEVEERAGYLFIVESGQLRTLRELHAYTSAVSAVVTESGIDRAIIDARGEVGDPPPEVRAAMWEWLSSPDQGFKLVAFILPTEMAVARVNMTALSRRAPVRAFHSVQEAQRWLTRGPRASSLLAMPADRPSSRPPPLDGPDGNAPTERPPPIGARDTLALPRAPSVPAEAKVPSSPPPSRASERTPSERAARPSRPGEAPGFRRPEPGPSERASPTKVRAPSSRPTRESEVRSRRDDASPSETSSGRPPKGGGSRVA